MPDIRAELVLEPALPLIELMPEQGIQTIIDKVYLWNADVANTLLIKINELLEKLQNPISYDDLIDKPLLDTSSSLPLQPTDGETIQHTISLHKISKTGSYEDLVNKPQIVTPEELQAETDARIAADEVLQGNIDAEAQTRANDIAEINEELATYGDIVTHDVDEFATAAQGAKADTAIQPNDNVSELTNDATYQTQAQVNTSIATHNTSETAHNDIRTAINSKQDTLTAGDNIDITGAVISAIDTTYTAGNGLTLTGTEFSANVINNTTSDSTTDALSAAAGKSLQEQVNNLLGRGKYLSIWDCTTGLAMDEPPVNPYTVETGSYFIVGKVASAGGTNYRPNGGIYDKDVPSTTIETGEVKVNDTYFYDGTQWRLLDTPVTDVAFSTLAGSPYDNTNLANALNGKQATISDLETIRSNASAGKSASDTIATYGDIVTHDTDEFATSSQGAKADTALQPGDNISELTNDSNYQTQAQVNTAISTHNTDTSAHNDIRSEVALKQDITDNSLTTTAKTIVGAINELDARPSAPAIDNKTITKNASQQLQASAVIDQNNTSNGIKTWTGTKAQYNALASKDSNTLYNITDEYGGGAIALVDEPGDSTSNAMSQRAVTYNVSKEIGTCVQFSGSNTITLTQDQADRMNDCDTISIRFITRGTAANQGEYRYFGFRAPIGTSSSYYMNVYWRYDTRLFYNNYLYSSGNGLNYNGSKYIAPDCYTLVINRVTGTASFYAGTTFINSYTDDSMKSDYFIDPTGKRFFILGGDVKTRVYDIQIFDDDISKMFVNATIKDSNDNASGAQLLPLVLQGGYKSAEKDWTNKNASSYASGSGWKSVYSGGHKTMTANIPIASGNRCAGGYYIGGADDFHVYRYKSYITVSGGNIAVQPGNTTTLNTFIGVFDVNTNLPVEDYSNIAPGDYYIEGYCSGVNRWAVSALSGEPVVYHDRDVIKRINCLFHFKGDILYNGSLYDDEVGVFYPLPSGGSLATIPLRQPLIASGYVGNYVHYDGELKIDQPNGNVYVGVNYTWKRINNA